MKARDFTFGGAIVILKYYGDAMPMTTDKNTLNFQPHLIKEAVYAEDTNELAIAITRQLEEMDKDFNGIFNPDNLTILLTSLNDIEKEDAKAGKRYSDVFWRVVYDTHYLKFRYGEILQNAFENYSTLILLTEQILESYFQNVEPSVWLSQWNKDSLDSLIFRNSIKAESATYFSLDSSDIAYHFISRIETPIQDFFLKRLSDSGMAIYLREIYRNIFSKNGSYGDYLHLRNVFTKRPSCIAQANHELTNMIKHMAFENCKQTFFDDDFHSSSISLMRSKKPHTLLYVVKMTHVSKGTIGELVKLINKTKSKPDVIIQMVCANNDITPLDLLSHPAINEAGKGHCMDMIMT